MSGTSDALSLIGRIFLAVVFVVSGFEKIAGFAGLVGAITSKGLPAAQVFAVATIVIELGVGLMLVAGWKTRWAAFALAVFTAVATVFFHNFWAVPESAEDDAADPLYEEPRGDRRLAAADGHGPGRLSVDRR